MRTHHDHSTRIILAVGLAATIVAGAMASHGGEHMLTEKPALHTATAR